MADHLDSAPGERPHVERRRLELLVNSITNFAIFMMDRDGYVVSWNPGAASAYPQRAQVGDPRRGASAP